MSPAHPRPSGPPAAGPQDAGDPLPSAGGAARCGLSAARANTRPFAQNGKRKLTSQ